MLKIDFRTDLLPDLSKTATGVAMISQWQTKNKDDQKKAVDVAMNVWENFHWPDGLLSYSCYTAREDTSILHYSQWRDKEAIDQFYKNDPPERVRQITQTVSIQRLGVQKYRLYKSYAEQEIQPGVIVFVKQFFKERGDAEGWIDLILAALKKEKEHPGLISAHYHISEDGLQLVNFAQWRDEGTYGNFLKHSYKETASLWDTIENYPGWLKQKGVIGKYDFAKSIIAY